MTTPANLTYANIETRVANQLRIPTSNTGEMTKIAALINEVYRDIYVKYDWWFLLKRTVLNTVAKLSEGTASVTLGSTAITFSSAQSADLLGWIFSVPSNANDAGALYRINSTSTAATAHTLDAAFTGATSTAAGYRLYQDALSLPADCGKLLQVKRYGELLPLRPIGKEEMMMLKIRDTSEGKPQFYSIFDYATTGDPTTARLLQIHPFPDKAARLEILYKQQLNTELSSTTQPFLPDEYRQILIYGALSRGYPIFLNDLERGKFFQALFNDMVALMVAQQREYASDLPNYYPENDYRRSRARGVGSYTLGSWFDRLPNVP